MEPTIKEDPDAKPAVKAKSQKVIRRKRATLSCLECTRRKVKCDRNRPCGTCLKRNIAHLCVSAPNAHVHGAGGNSSAKKRVGHFKPAPPPAAPPRQYAQPAYPPPYSSTFPGLPPNLPSFHGGMPPGMPGSMPVSQGMPLGLGTSAHLAPGLTPGLPSALATSPLPVPSTVSHAHLGGLTMGPGPGRPPSAPELEKRVSFLENVIRSFQQHEQQLARSMGPYSPQYSSPYAQHSPYPAPYSNASASTHSTTSPGAYAPGAMSATREHDSNDSETEDAALVLEDMAIGVRMARVTMRKGHPDMAPPVPVAKIDASSSEAPSPARSGFEDLLAPSPPPPRAAMDALRADVPPPAQLIWMLEYYWDKVDWGWHLYHQGSFWREYAMFKELCNQGRFAEIDPLWLAILFVILATAIHTLQQPPTDSPLPLTVQDICQLPRKFFALARTALELADWTGRARFRAVQAIALASPYLLFGDEPHSVERLCTFTAIGIRLSQQLGLDKLGNDYIPAGEAGLPTTAPPVVKREIALRTFHAILNLDQILFRCRPMLQRQFVDCPFPANYEDEDLPVHDATATVPPPRPASDLTFTALERVRIETGVLQRRYHEDVIENPDYAYESVLAVDDGFKDLLERYPIEKRRPGETLAHMWARTMAVQNVGVRIIRINRPFMPRGYREDRYRPSTEAAVKAARTVLRAEVELDRTGAPLVKYSFHAFHLQTAVVVLFLEIWMSHGPNAAQNRLVERAPQSDMPDDHLIASSISTFSRGLNSVRARVRKVSRQNIHIIQGLFHALSSPAADGTKETYTRALRAIGQTVLSAENAAGDTMPGSLAPERWPGPLHQPGDQEPRDEKPKMKDAGAAPPAGSTSANSIDLTSNSSFAGNMLNVPSIAPFPTQNFDMIYPSLELDTSTNLFMEGAGTPSERPSTGILPLAVGASTPSADVASLLGPSFVPNNAGELALFDFEFGENEGRSTDWGGLGWMSMPQ